MAKPAPSPQCGSDPSLWRRDPDNLIPFPTETLHQSVKPSAALNAPSWRGGIFPPWITHGACRAGRCHHLRRLQLPHHNPQAQPWALHWKQLQPQKLFQCQWGLGTCGVPVPGGAGNAQMLSAILTLGGSRTDFPHATGLHSWMLCTSSTLTTLSPPTREAISNVW